VANFVRYRHSRARVSPEAALIDAFSRRNRSLIAIRSSLTADQLVIKNADQTKPWINIAEAIIKNAD
jgi:hypothetical protein